MATKLALKQCYCLHNEHNSWKKDTTGILLPRDMNTVSIGTPLGSLIFAVVILHNFKFLG